MDKFKCGLCEKSFKSEAGLVGHMRLSHDEGRIKNTPDKIGQRLEAIEARLAGTKKSGKPGNPVDSEESLVITLKLLLPAMERFGLVVVNFGSRYDEDYMEFKRLRVVKNPAFSKAGFGGLVLGDNATEL